MQGDYSSILPTGATPLELAAERASGERWADLDVDVIRRFKNPDECPEHFLPFLAFERSIGLWMDNWSVEQQRDVIRRFYEYQTSRGTAAGLRKYFALVGAEVRRIDAPPQYTVLRHGPSDAERQAWLDQFQQVRIYPHMPVATNTLTRVLRRHDGRSRLALGHFGVNSRAVIHGRIRQARLFEPRTGEETILTRREVMRDVADFGPVYDYEDLALKVRSRALVIGRSLRAGPLRGGGLAFEKTVRIRVERRNLTATSSKVWSATVPTGRLTKVEPELVRTRTKVGGPAIGNCSTGRRTHMVAKANRAWEFVYERFYLFDRSRDRGVSAGYPGSAIGRTRISMPAFTARVKVRYTLKPRPTDLRLGASLSNKAIRARDPEVMRPLLKAASAAKALRDQIFIDTTSRRKQRFGDGIRFGSARFGGRTDT